MRHGSAQLHETTIKLADLEFPHDRVHIFRTRLSFIHLDNLLHFAKVDRDGLIEGYVAAYLPHELVLLLFKKGELATALAFSGKNRTALPIESALDQIRTETERADLVFCDAPIEQLAWMQASCEGPAVRRHLDESNPASLFPNLKDEHFSGVVELISDGRINYLRFMDGDFSHGYYCGKVKRISLARFVESQFERDGEGRRPALAVSVFPAAKELIAQASPARIQTYRELFGRITEGAETELPGEGSRRAADLLSGLNGTYPALKAIGTPSGGRTETQVVTKSELTVALAEWAKALFEQLEILAPGVASRVLKEATKEHRFVLQKAGFYDRLPWTVTW